ncbi:hypothetical protein ACFZA0_37220, partial [Streptomyces sp. NPDC008150]
TCLVDRIEPLHSVVVSLAPGAASLSSEARASLLRAADPNAPEVLTYLAVGVIPAADHPDPLQAACDALSGAVGVFGPDWPAVSGGVGGIGWVSAGQGAGCLVMGIVAGGPAVMR